MLNDVFTVSMLGKKIERVRDLINDPSLSNKFLKNKASWNKICSSMDVIDDTQIAIDYFFSLSNFSVCGEGYLFVYGLLQALFLQQDAVNNLSYCLINEEIDWKKDYPRVFKIREIRNDTCGHPTGRGNDKSFHFIRRESLSIEGFELISEYFESQDTIYRNIKLRKMKEDQENDLTDILDKIVKGL